MVLMSPTALIFTPPLRERVPSLIVTVQVPLPVTAKAASPVPPSAVKLSLPLEQTQLLPAGYLAQISA